MGMLRVTLVVQIDLGSATESHYVVGSEQITSTVITNAINLANKRAALLGANAYIRAVRIKDLAIPRKVYTVNPTLYTRTGYSDLLGTTPSDNVDDQNDAIMITMETAPLSVKLMLAGAPDFATNYSPANSPSGYVPEPTFDSLLRAYIAALIAGYGIAYNLKTGAEFGNALIPAPAPYTGLAMAVFPNPIAGLAVGKTIFLRSWKRTNYRYQGVNGSWSVAGIVSVTTPVVGTGYVLSGSQSVITSNIVETGGGFPYAPIVAPYIDFAIERSATRKRGASYGRRVGRSKSRR